MTITPQQARENNLMRNKGLLEQLERKIDEALVESCDLGVTKDICIDVPKGLYPGTPVYQRLIQMYEKAGWKVKYESDQREGAWLRFTQGKSA